jgi:hypothetical protein
MMMQNFGHGPEKLPEKIQSNILGDFLAFIDLYQLLRQAGDPAFGNIADVLKASPDVHFWA